MKFGMMRPMVALAALIVAAAGAAVTAPPPPASAEDSLGKPEPEGGMCWNPAYLEVRELYDQLPDHTYTDSYYYQNRLVYSREITGKVGGRTSVTYGRDTGGEEGTIDITHVVPYIRCGDPPNYRIPAHDPPKPWVTIPAVIVVGPDGTPLYDRN